MRILMVWDGDYPWDVRVEKICLTLIRYGHEVHLVCRNGKAQPRRETISGINIRRTFTTGSQGAINSLLTFPAFFSPIWRNEVRNAIGDLNPDVVIIRDLPIALAVVPFTRQKNIPTVLDMAECYPEMLRCAWKFEKFRLQNAFVRNPAIADIVEKRVLKQIDRAWVMVEESGERLQRKGLSKEKICIVSNTPLAADTSLSNHFADKSELHIVYVGLVNPSRGLATVIEAARILKDKKIGFRLTIAGSGKDFARIVDLIEKNQLSEQVLLLGWVDHSRIAEIIQNSDVGLVPHYRCSHWDNTIPNKIFDYMRAGIPVIVSDAIPAKRIIEQTRAGLSYESFDANALANQLIALRDPIVRKEFGANGVNAIRKKYNWESDTEALLHSLNELTQNGISA